MKLVVSLAIIALAFTTGFTCSKNTPEEVKTEAPAQPTEAPPETQEQMAQPPAEGAAPTETAPAPTEVAPAEGENKQ